MTSIDFTNFTEGRYDRHELISWWDQKKVSNAKIIVIGAGALGNEVLKLLALIGIGHITVVDFDTISPSNLARMVLFREGDVGKPKVQVAAERLREINPEVQVHPRQGDLRFVIGLGEYLTADVVLGCLDSVNARWALNRKCMQAGVEWIDGAISDFHGLIARYSSTEGACYECNFTPHTMERFNRRYSCPFGLVSDQAEDKVPTTAITTSIIAAFQVQQALMMLHGIDEGLNPGERLTVYMKPYRMIKDRLPFNEDCFAHAQLPKNIPFVKFSKDMTVNMAIQEAQHFNPGVNTLVLPHEFVVEFLCTTCGEREAILMPKESVYQNHAVCVQCGQIRVPQIITNITKGTLHAEIPLKTLAFPNHEILQFTGNESSIYLQFDQ